MWERQAKWVKIQIKNPAPALMEEEIFSTDIQDLKYRNFPGQMKILLPWKEKCHLHRWLICRREET